MNPWANNSNFYPQPYYHPGVYYPSGWAQPVPPPVPPPVPTRSSKYPNLHHILAADSTTLKLDLKQKPRTGLNASTFYAYRQVPAMAHPVTHMRLISKAFPWSIEIMSPGPITCEAVWDALYSGLHGYIEDSEWGCIVRDKKHRETVEKAAKNRAETDRDTKLKRIDWLGESTIFRGLEKVDDFEKMRLLPGSQACPETWVVKMSD